MPVKKIYQRRIALWSLLDLDEKFFLRLSNYTLSIGAVLSISLGYFFDPVVFLLSIFLVLTAFFLFRGESAIMMSNSRIKDSAAYTRKDFAWSEDGAPSNSHDPLTF